MSVKRRYLDLVHAEFDFCSSFVRLQVAKRRFIYYYAKPFPVRSGSARVACIDIAVRGRAGR
jgi:hypothetical protein